jgi:hypothetical protein
MRRSVFGMPIEFFSRGLKVGKVGLVLKIKASPVSFKAEYLYNRVNGFISDEFAVRVS